MAVKTKARTKKKAVGKGGIKGAEVDHASAKGGAEGSHGNKAAAIRAYLNAHPTAKGKEVAETLKRRGIEVTPNYVSLMRSKLRPGKTSRRKAGKKPKAIRHGAAGNGFAANPVHAIQAAAVLLKTAGNLDDAKTALKFAADLASSFK